MSQYGTYYTMSWLTAQEDVTVTATIYDTEHIIADGDSPTVYELTPTGNPCTISVINNDRKKWGIKAKQAKLEFYSVPGINAYNFTDSNDTRWLCEIKANAEDMILTGYVVLTDISRPFLPDKQVITLTVSDGLGLLKEKPLTLDGGGNPTGKFWIAYWLNLALKKTGLNLELFVHNNIRPYLDGTFLGTSHHLYSDIYLDAKTFEKQIGECEDCYTVIEKIIDKDCFLTQYKGAWWIMRPDDFDGNNVYYARFNLSATLISYDNTLDNGRNIGVGEVNQWVQASQGVEYERPYKFSKHTYKYETPLETPCNVDFVRGDLLTVVSPTEKHYEIDCWTLKRGYPTSPQSTTITPYIKREFNAYDYEISRVVVLPNASTITYKEYIESEGIPVDLKDRFDVSFDWRLQSSTGFGFQYLRYCSVVLHGSDGSWWMLGGVGGASDPSYDPGTSYFKWYNTSGFTVNTAASEILVDFNTTDETDWNSFTWEAPPCPIDGTVYIWLNQFKQVSSSNSDRVIEYQNLSFDYHPYINGTYQKFNGQTSKVSRDNYSANLDEEVSISDSPKPMLKGGMFTYSSGIYSLHSEYFNATPFSNGSPPDTTYVHPYEYIRVFSTFNQYRRGIRFFTGTIKGLGSNWPDLIHKYYLTDTDYDSNGRTFQLLSFEQNWKTGLWSATLAECWHTDGKVYTDDFEWKYIE